MGSGDTVPCGIYFQWDVMTLAILHGTVSHPTRDSLQMSVPTTSRFFALGQAGVPATRRRSMSACRDSSPALCGRALGKLRRITTVGSRVPARACSLRGCALRGRSERQGSLFVRMHRLRAHTFEVWTLIHQDRTPADAHRGTSAMQTLARRSLARYFLNPVPEG